MKRIDRVAYRKSAITPDTAEVMRLLEQNAAKKYPNVVIRYEGPERFIRWDTVESPTQCPGPISLLPAGREVHLSVEIKDWEGDRPESKRQAELNILWELALPLGFIPWCRYPHPNVADKVFHFFGPWRSLYDHLCGEGRGEIAWPSVCCAAQVDVGMWEGTRVVERFVQAQLHRLGAPCGPVDGIIGDRTTLAIRSLGFQGMALGELAEFLRTYEVESKTQEGQRQFGYIVLPGWKMVAQSYGKVHTTHIPQGVALTVDGPGRVVIDVDQEGVT